MACVGNAAGTQKASPQVFPGLYGQALSRNGGALCVSTEAEGTFVFIFLQEALQLSSLSVGVDHCSPT